ncbi:MAG: hypothetical protein CMM00_12925 [Rhodopirellula sp.]|nr:hypothetical protein [Rhodopirellula sp.]
MADDTKEHAAIPRCTSFLQPRSRTRIRFRNGSLNWIAHGISVCIRPSVTIGSKSISCDV